MQLLHEHKIPVVMKDFNMSASISMKKASCDNFEVKEKRSSDASLRLMNPVASGDNVANLNSVHKLKEESPPLVPCCEGKELQISEDLVRSGLSAISVKHDGVIQCQSMSRACERMLLPGLFKHRNSFRCLHRPDLKRVPYLRRMTPDELEMLFRGYADLPHRSHNESRDDAPRLSLPPDENIRSRDLKDKEARSHDDGAGTTLHPIPETRFGTEDVPAGMRLHGARARLYTSVLAGAKAGDQLEQSTNEDFDIRVPDEIIPEDEVQLTEDLQIILPPRCDDITTESSINSSHDSHIS
ncbi:uncharacterized protein LOC128682164 isoform X2 [Plodia interpunctella]|uniref:uncharacterized protein LOC128682164 isoform X2 n=1 Tax=Plodia interpunctella TaxID=58824 RepID=UPI0023686EC1|nr:uncharacterized protein LOC128682164 isoform X2 [Plodia interpunctella]